MNKLFKWIILLAIWNSILFFNKSLGISVILFMLPFIIFIIYVLKSNEKIINKNGLLLIIPILMLSVSYCIYNQTFFKILNSILIPFLTMLMFIMCIRPTNKFKTILQNIFGILIKPFSYINRVMNIIFELLSKKLTISSTSKKVIKSILILIPFLIIILLLLTSADMIFESMISKIINIKYIMKLLTFKNFKNLSYRIIIILIFFLYLSVVLNYILFTYPKEKSKEKELKVKNDNLTIKVILTAFNVVYIIFDFIQIKSLLFHSVSSNINYAEYARQGFLQLMIISIINIVLILISKKFEENDSTKNKYIKSMSLLMVLLTFIIIISSFFRMNLYESEFGYTFLRLLVYVILFTETLLLIPTIIYIIKKNFNITKSYFIIVIVIYTFINFVNIDEIIAVRNINRYNVKNDIDIEYLENGRADNIPILIKLYNKVEDKEIKEKLYNYLKGVDLDINGFQEFNISKLIAKQKIKKLK